MDGRKPPAAPAALTVCARARMLWGMMRVFGLQLTLAATAALAAAPKPPEQPKTGPGGSDYRHAKVVSRVFGTGVDQYWILEPAEPTPPSAPVVVFHHGWMDMQPTAYLGWLHHIVRRGNIVIFPRYQAGALTAPWTFTSNALTAVTRALARLKAGGHVAPELERFAIVGHSAGGAISADMAALAADKGLPKPKALMIVQPGRGTRRARSLFFPAADCKKIPADVALLVLVGDRDRIVADRDAKAIFLGTPQIPLGRKDYIVVRTDRHGSPPLVADHVSPCAPVRPHGLIRARRINALDYYAYWRLLDALLDFAFHGKNKRLCLGNTPEQRFMGKWSDGTPVKELSVTDKP